MKLKQGAAALLLMVATMPLAWAHGPKVGANGGVQVDADGFHVEVVAQGTTLRVFVRDHADKPVTTEGYKGTAIFIVGGKPQRIVLAPAGENRLTGTSAVSIQDGPKGVVQITTPAGSTIQAKFN